MFKKYAGALALAAAMVGTAQAGYVTINAGESMVFNFAAAPAGAQIMELGDYGGPGGEVGTITFYSGFNLAGSVIHTKSPSDYSPSNNVLSNAELFDGFSIQISITSGSFMIEPVAYFDEGIFVFNLGEVRGTVGNTSGLTPTPPTSGNDVPEPGTLSLLALAGAGLVASRRRTTKATAAGAFSAC